MAMAAPSGTECSDGVWSRVFARLFDLLEIRARKSKPTTANSTG